MPLKALRQKPGINRENTRYTNENGYYESEKVRFRQGTPEKIGGWQQLSTNSFLGVARSLWNWVTLGLQNLLGIGTNLKFYVEQGGAYFDITPIRATATLTGPFAATTGSNLVTVTDAAAGYITGDFVTFSGATGLGGNITATVLNQEYQITVTGPSTYTITTSVSATAGDSGTGGTVSAAYQINVGTTSTVASSGWGALGWGEGPWGSGNTSRANMRLWSQHNFGEDLLFAPFEGGIYRWKADTGTSNRGVLVSSLLGASSVPVTQSFILVSATSRFVFAFGANDYGETTPSPMLIRWSDQESYLEWFPAATNQAGSIPLSSGSKIITAIQSRQEILVVTDSAIYSLQYVGAPAVWSSTILADNVSIAGQNSIAVASGVTYWMGVDKFYMYDGRVQTLKCDLRQFIFSDINLFQAQQFFASSNEGFNEVWFFYCSANSTSIDRYVIYNYQEQVWSYGTMRRSAWLDSGLRDYPMAATYPDTGLNNIVYHEYGVDDNATTTPAPIYAMVATSEFDIDDGDHFGFVRRILPDITFIGSQIDNPKATMTLLPMQNSGSGYNVPQSTTTSSGDIIRSATVPIEKFTGQINIRVRGRQMVLKLESNQIGCTWQLGTPRLDIKVDGRR